MCTCKKRIFLLLLATVFLFGLCGCDLSDTETDTDVDIDYTFYYALRTVYAASTNVYTGELLDICLYEKIISDNSKSPTYTIKVKVKEVFKGDFVPGDIVEDLCTGEFSDVGCDYLFMTDPDPDFGYDSITYVKADNVYSGKILKLEPYQPSSPDIKAPMYKVTVEVQEVFKGDYVPGQIVEDITSGWLDELRGEVILMTATAAEEKPYLGLWRLAASNVLHRPIANLYCMVKLPGDNRVEYMYPNLPENDRYLGYEGGIPPPKTEEELLRQVRDSHALPSSYHLFFPGQELTTEHPTVPTKAFSDDKE